MVLSSGKSFCEKLHDVSPCKELYDSDLRKDINKVASTFGFNQYVESPVEMPTPNGVYTTYVIKLFETENEEDSVVIIITRPTDGSDRSIYLNGDVNGVGFEFEIRYNKEWRRKAYNIGVSKNGLCISVKSVERDRVDCISSVRSKRGFLNNEKSPWTCNADFNSILDWFKRFTENPEERFKNPNADKINSEKAMKRA